MTEKKYSITTSNFKKIIEESKIKIEEDITITFKSIYGEINLRPYLNEKEAIDIRKLIDFLLNSETYVSTLKKQKGDSQGKKTIPLQSRYIFTSSSSSPKYHKNNECRTLLNNFENFEIPREIEVQGKEEIAKFREFARENRGLLKNGKEHLFIIKLKEKFNLNSDINKISFNNSGKIEVLKMSTPNIKEEISKIIKNLEAINNSDAGRKSIKKYMFVPGKMIKIMEKNETLCLGDLEVIAMKKKLLDLIIEFNIQKNKGLTFTENVLEFYGFEKCGVCFSDEIRYEL